MTIVLEDQGGNRIPRFGVAGVQKALTNPVKATSDAKSFNKSCQGHKRRSF
jgi:hypothetical protein